MVHHDSIMFFALGVVSKYDGDAFSLRRKDLRIGPYVCIHSQFSTVFSSEITIMI